MEKVDGWRMDGIDGMDGMAWMDVVWLCQSNGDERAYLVGVEPGPWLVNSERVGR